MAARTLTIGSLCTGYGGLDIGIGSTRRTRSLWLAETDPDAACVAARRWPRVPNLGDIRAVRWGGVEVPDVLTAGFPCQPVSAAGRQRGVADERWLWPAVRDAAERLRPQVVFLENVRNIASVHDGSVMATIMADLADLRYACRWLYLGACAVGGAHHRHRWFLRGELMPGRRRPPAPVQVDVESCGARRGQPLLPTATARDGDGRGEGGAEYWGRRGQVRVNGLPLGAVVAMLPTPQRRDGDGRGSPGRELATTRINAGRRNLDDAVALLSGPEVPVCDWGRYAHAVERAESVFGPAPCPVIPGANGGVRLAPRFVEWMMGLDAGQVSDHVNRNAALRILGNGAMPAQVDAAWSLLADV